MTKRMLIDATHAEETRVVVLDGNRLEDFDVETSTKRQLKGNIYLAKVVRVEPSLQACFVEYGGNRHGFLAFSEIHPDYYQIPVADRQRLIEMEEEEARREEEEADRALDAAPAEPPPAAAAAAEAAAETVAGTAEESGSTVAVPHVAAAEQAQPPDADAPRPAAMAAEAFDESAASPATALEPPARPATPEQGDSPPGVAAALDAAAPRAGAPAGSGDGVTAALAPATAGQAPAATQQVPAPAAAMAEPTDAAGLPATEPPDAAIAPGTDQPDTSSAAGAPAGEPSEPSTDAAAPNAGLPEPPAAVAPPEQPVAAAASSAAAPEPPDGGEPGPGPDDGRERQSRRAQPLIIESETVTGEVDTDAAEDEADATHFAPADRAGFEPEPEFGLDHDVIPESPPPETIGGEPENGEEHRERRIPPRFLRNYKIQEVIRRRQILLVQVVKEERGTKGAALTTYLSLAGRFSVLMPNSPRGGGISRKITSATDRRRLKEIIHELDMPKGMGLIVRTAGANRPKPEIKRDCEYLLRLWDDIRDHTLRSVAPALIYEEASLIKRAIRDVYSRDIDEIQVDGEDGWRAAHDFMRMLMPSHAKKVLLWRDQSQPLFSRYQVEAQLDGMLQPIVQLRSGGYLVINQAEALVAIDVNSGRATRERNVEETALRTNLEAADEVARQLRLRDLAGLIVIDFIDMESKKHNAMVERRIKEALKNDRARIQVGHISHFGLLEMSRQRLRPSLAETSFILGPHCGGTGHVRSTESAAVHVLRGIEEEGSKRRAAEIVVHVATATALYILNHKRDRLREIEHRYGMRVTVLGDATQMASQFRIERGRPQVAREGAPAAVTPDAPQPSWTPSEPEAEEPDEAAADEEAAGEEDVEEEEEEGAAEPALEQTRDEAGEDKGEQGDRRRRRRRRRRGRREEGQPQAAEAPMVAMPEEETPFGPESEAEAVATEAPAPVEDHVEGVPEYAESGSDEDGRRRRSRRGGRRRRREPGEGEASPFAVPGTEQPPSPVYLGPTPANPFGGQAFDIFDVLEQAEANAAAARAATPEPVVQQFEPVPAAAAFVPAPVGPAAAAEPAAATAPSSPDAVPPAAPEIVNTGALAPGTAEAAAEPAAPEPMRGPTVTEPAAIGEAYAAPEPGAAAPAAAGTTPEAAEPIMAPATSVTESETTVGDAAAPAASEVTPEPAIRPIVIGSGEDQPMEKKRGWWRR